MGKPSRKLPARAVAATLTCAALLGAAVAAPAAASRGCPQVTLKRQPALRNLAHPPVHAVLACVGTTPITGARWAHWLAIEQRSFKHFHVAELKGITLATLWTEAAVEAEAREHHVVVTAQAVRRALQHKLRTRFRRPGSFQRFLRARGERTADYLVDLRVDLLTAALLRREGRAEAHAFNAKWQQRTTCTRAVADGTVCGLNAPFAAGPPALGIPGGAEEIGLDPASDTVYVASSIALTLIDGKTCNASVTIGCTHPRVVHSPDTDIRGLSIDPATSTLYVAAADTDSIAVLDTRTCNAAVARCKPAASVRLGSHVTPQQLVLDPTTHTLYALDDGIHTISVVDAAHCNALDHSGCGKRPARLRTPDDFPNGIAVDPTTSTLYVANDNGYSVSLVDTRTCSALDASRCTVRPPTFKLPGIANPLAFAIDPATHALYVAADDDRLFALDAATCNATVRSGCGHPRSVRVRETGDHIAIDAPTHTAYLTGRFAGGAQLVDVAACNPGNGAGCRRTPPLAHTDREGGELAIDERTRTVYVLNDDTVSLIRADRCNATTTAGC